MATNNNDSFATRTGSSGFNPASAMTNSIWNPINKTIASVAQKPYQIAKSYLDTINPVTKYLELNKTSQDIYGKGGNPYTSKEYWLAAAKAVGGTAAFAAKNPAWIAPQVAADVALNPGATTMYLQNNNAMAQNPTAPSQFAPYLTNPNPSNPYNAYGAYQQLSPTTGNPKTPQDIKADKTAADLAKQQQAEFQATINRMSQLTPEQQAALNAAKAAAQQQFNSIKAGATQSISATDLGTAKSLENQYRTNTGQVQDMAGLMTDLGMPLSPAQYGSSVESIYNQGNVANANVLTQGAESKAQQLANIISGQAQLGNSSANVALQKAQMEAANRDYIAGLLGIKVQGA